MIEIERSWACFCDCDMAAACGQGMTDGGVQVAAVSVFPLCVAAALRQEPLIADAAVRVMRREERTRLKESVVPRAGLAGDLLLIDLEHGSGRSGESRDERLTAPVDSGSVGAL